MGARLDLKLEWEQHVLEISEFPDLQLGASENRPDLSQTSTTFLPLPYPSFIRLECSGTALVQQQGSSLLDVKKETMELQPLPFPWQLALSARGSSTLPAKQHGKENVSGSAVEPVAGLRAGLCCCWVLRGLTALGLSRAVNNASALTGVLFA